MDVAEVERALQGLRVGLQSDGADLIVNSASAECIDLSLVFTGKGCPDCLVGTEILLAKVRLLLNKVFPRLPRLVLHDPRSGEREAR